MADWSPDQWEMFFFKVIAFITALSTLLLTIWGKLSKKHLQREMDGNRESIRHMGDRITEVAVKAVPPEAVQKLLDTPPVEARKPWFDSEDAKKQD